MPHLHRFYVAPDSPAEGTLILSSDEAHHARRVVRLRDGEAVECFDGAGGVWRGVYRSAGAKDAAVEIASYETETRPDARVTLAQAWLHRPKAVEELLRRGTEVGVNRFVFFQAERSERAPKVSDKWTRLLVDVCKQCGRNWLPEIEIAGSLDAVLSTSQGLVFWCDMESDRPIDSLEPAPAEHLLVIGPEGDFTEAESESLRASGATPVSLGEYTYRSEVAAVLGATLLLSRLGAYRPGER